MTPAAREALFHVAPLRLALRERAALLLTGSVFIIATLFVAAPTMAEDDFQDALARFKNALARDAGLHADTHASDQKVAASSRALVEKHFADRPYCLVLGRHATEPLPDRPKAPTLPPPPDAASLAQKRSDSAALAELANELGVLAQSIGAAVSRNPRAGLAAQAGAAQGRREGERERYARALAQWKAETYRAVSQYELDRSVWLQAVAFRQQAWDRFKQSCLVER